MIKPLKTGIITAAGVLGFLVIALVINGTTRIFEVPVVGTVWRGIIQVGSFPFSLLQRLYRPLVETNPTGMARILLDQLFFVLPPLFWGSIAFVIQKHRTVETSNQ
jgi:hypothetical protein